MQDALTVGAAAAETGWSARMLRYLEEHGLVVPRRTAAGYRALRPRRAEPAALAAASCGAGSASSSPSSRSPAGCAASPSCATRSTPGSQPATTPAPGSSGSSASTSGCSPPDPTTGLHCPATKDGEDHGDDEATRRKGSVARPRGRAAHHVGRPADAGAARRSASASSASSRSPATASPPACT